MSTTPLDLVSTVTFSVALALLVRARAGAIGSPARVFLALCLALYAFMGLSGLLQHLGVTSVLDHYEDDVEILFPAMFAFFVFAARSHQEIAERRSAEERAATESERLAVTLESIADAVVATNVDGRVVVVNAAAERLLERGRHELLGSSLEEVVRLVDETSGVPRPSPVATVLGVGPARGLAGHPVLVVDGRHRLVEDSAAPIRDHTGRLRGAVLILRDVTEQRGVQQELLKIQKLESLGVLAGGIAHDFNNILTAILGSLSLARIYSGASGKAEAVLDQAEAATLRARDLTRQLLTFARGGAPIKQPHDVGELVRDAATFALRGSRVRCELRIEPDLAWVDCDEGQLSQVIQNLVRNAREAVPEGGRVAVSTEGVSLETGDVAMLRPGRYVRITIEDDGVGITPELLTRVFDPYFTTKERGSGLGLATAFSVVRQHDGYILADSGSRAGTRMRVYLPASAARPAAAAARSATAP